MIVVERSQGAPEALQLLTYPSWWHVPELVGQTGWICLTVEDKEMLQVDFHSKPRRVGTRKAEFGNNSSLLIAISSWTDITVISDWEKAAQLLGQ